MTDPQIPRTPTVIPGLPIARGRASFTDPGADRLIDQIIQVVNNLGGQKQALGVGRLGYEALLADDIDLTKTDHVFNTAKAVLTPGQVLGHDSDGTLALAYAAGSSLIVPFGVCVVSTGRQANLLFGSYSTWPVRLESDSIAPTPGDPAWLSASVAGTATDTRPSSASDWKILLGQFVAEKDPISGLCDMTILIGPPVMR